MADDDHDTNLVLTGFMGTGKTTVGRVLAARLGRRFVDTDEIIEQRHGPIPRIFAEQGEGRFRQIERQTAAELGAARGLVIATGGRLLLDPDNAEALTAKGTVVCLAAPVDEILARVTAAGVSGRPLLDAPDPRARIAALLEERRAGYARFPQVETQGRSPDEVADEVLRVAGLS